jgi:cell division septation protein DedD
MIAALLLAVAVAGQLNDEPAAKKAEAPVVFVPAPAQKPTKKAARKAQAKALESSKASSQAQSVVNARKARRRAYNTKEAVQAAADQAEYKRQLIAQEKAIKEYQAYVVKMGPIWAAENANQIQAQRNAIMARQTDIMKQQADNDAYLVRGLLNSR